MRARHESHDTLFVHPDDPVDKQINEFPPPLPSSLPPLYADTRWTLFAPAYFCLTKAVSTVSFKVNAYRDDSYMMFARVREGDG